jgi:hypothetical protein
MGALYHLHARAARVNCAGQGRRDIAAKDCCLAARGRLADGAHSQRQVAELLGDRQPFRLVRGDLPEGGFRDAHREPSGE